MANVKDVVSTNADLVNYLLVNKFHTLCYDDKIFVKKLPVPQPSMVDLIQSKSFLKLCKYQKRAARFVINCFAGIVYSFR
jgi:hypothetical protein